MSLTRASALRRKQSRMAWQPPMTFVTMAFGSANSDHFVSDPPRGLQHDQAGISRPDHDPGSLSPGLAADAWRQANSPLRPLRQESAQPEPAMTSEEVIALVTANDGELCGLVTRAADGALVTADRRRRPFRHAKPWQFKISNLMTLVAGVAAGVRVHPARLFAANCGWRNQTKSNTAGHCPRGARHRFGRDLEPEGCLSDSTGSVPDVLTPGAQP